MDASLHVTTTGRMVMIRHALSRQRRQVILPLPQLGCRMLTVILSFNGNAMSFRINVYQDASIGMLLLMLISICLPVHSIASPTTTTAQKATVVGNIKLHGSHTDESWATPEMSTTRLHSQVPVTAEKDDHPRFTREMIEVGWRSLDSFHLYVVKPKGTINPPVILYLYNYNNDTRRFLNDDYCERITRSGCAAVGFETALSGDRFQMRPMNQWFVSELPESLATSAHDVQMVLNYLTTRGDLDMGRVGMFGQGSGGAVAILAAGADPRIKSLDLLDPWGDWPLWLKTTAVIPDTDRAKLTEATFEKKVVPLEPLTWLAGLTDRKIRIIQVKDNTTTPAACQEALAKAAPPGTQFVHYDTNLNLFGALGHGGLFVWSAKQLNAKPAPTQAAVAVPTKH